MEWTNRKCLCQSPEFWSEAPRKRPQRDKNHPFSHNHGRKRHFPPEPSILGVSLKNLLKESPYKKWPSAWGEQLLFVGTVGPRLGFPTSPMVGAKFFSLPVSLERPLGEIWTHFLVVRELGHINLPGFNRGKSRFSMGFSVAQKTVPKILVVTRKPETACWVRGGWSNIQLILWVG